MAKSRFNEELLTKCTFQRAKFQSTEEMLLFCYWIFFIDFFGYE